MVLVRAIVRTNKVDEVLEELMAAGFPSVTKMEVYGRGKQKGVKVGEVFYDELPKEMLLMVIAEEDVELVIGVIMEVARTGKAGNYGDGQIFVTPIEEAYTSSTRTKGL